MTANSTSFKKGESGNPSGRPRGSKNTSNPHAKLEAAIQSDYSINDLKELAYGLITAKDSKMSTTNVEKMIKYLMEFEIKLLEMDFINFKTRPDKKSPSKPAKKAQKFSTTAVK